MTDLQKSMRNTFLTLRLGVGVLGIAFPFILWLGGLYFYDLHLRGSMSAYYHASHACTDPAEPHEVPISENRQPEISSVLNLQFKNILVRFSLSWERSWASTEASVYGRTSL